MRPTAVITGVAGGIGGALARAVGATHRVVAVDLSERLDDVVAELTADGIEADAVRADLTDPTGVDRVREAAGEQVSLLVNNAGITRDARLAKLERADFDAVIAVNLGAVYRLTRALVPRMIDGSSIVSISSRAYLGNFGQFNYSMSKGAVVGMTRALALELAPRIRVNAVAPGLIETPMALAIPDDIRTRMVEAIPMQRMGRPHDIAETVMWLADADRSGYVTGEVIVVGGGRSLI